MASPKHRPSAAAPTTTSSKHRPPPPPHASRPPRQRPLLLRRAMLHSCLCFLLGLLTGLAPSGWTDAASRAAADANHQVFRALHAGVVSAINHTALLTTTLHQHFPNHHSHHHQQPQPQLVVVVTTTGPLSERERRAAGLTRTAHALRLVSPPVVWLVVEAAREAAPTALLLRRTGVPYRHLTYKDNFTSSESDGGGGGGSSWEEERHHQRNLALGHIEQHRLRGVVLFAGLADVYDLRLLEQLRQIRTLGSWPVATVWDQEKRVAVEGPICTSTGDGATASAWFSAAAAGTGTTTTRSTPPLMSDDSVHGFAFASDLLWDPARWDRFPTSEPDQSQDSIKFVQRLVVEDYNKTMTIPDYSNCSQIMTWRVDTTLLL